MSVYLEELNTRLSRIRAGRRALGQVDKTTAELLAGIEEIEAYVETQIREESARISEARYDRHMSGRAVPLDVDRSGARYSDD